MIVFRFGIFCVVAMFLALCTPVREARAQVSVLDPASQPRFVNPLPRPTRINATGGGQLTVTMAETRQHLGLFDPMTGEPLMTTVWGYDFGAGPTYPGATIEARKDVDLDVLWQNQLPFAHLLPVDDSLHWAFSEPTDGEYRTIAMDGVPTVVHLHGGHTQSDSDGLPESWYTPGFTLRGPHFSRTSDGTRYGTPLPFHYDNDQDAATLWYHDHALGITRLNVYAGLAGFYLLRDANEAALIATNRLPTGPYEVELVIQDRMFTSDGELFYPSDPPVPGAPDPSVHAEFFGDIMLVNGMAWPVLEVEPREYRFRMLNGSDSRFYDLSLMSPDGVPFYQIGSDTGLLDQPAERYQMLLAPGERLDMVVDFSDPRLSGHTLILRNMAKAPFPSGQPANPQTAGQIMAFRVTATVDTSVYPLTTLPASLRPTAIDRLVQTGITRQLILFEGVDEFGRLRPMLGTADAGALRWDAPITETPSLDDVEIWELYNVSADAHPIHLHLVSFQILDRRRFSANVDPDTGALSNIRFRGQRQPPPPGENGFKDTVVAPPGQVTRIIARFDRPGRYVWHCHILSHEDHEMMRPYYVQSP